MRLARRRVAGVRVLSEMNQTLFSQSAPQSTTRKHPCDARRDRRWRRRARRSDARRVLLFERTAATRRRYRRTGKIPHSSSAQPKHLVEARMPRARSPPGSACSPGSSRWRVTRRSRIAGRGAIVVCASQRVGRGFVRRRAKRWQSASTTTSASIRASWRAIAKRMVG